MATKPQDNNDSKKILRLGVIENGRILEETLFRERKSISVGQNFKNDLVLPSEQAPQSSTLFELGSDDTYKLVFTPDMRGRVLLDDGVFGVEELISSGKATAAGKNYKLPLPETARGKIAVGDSTILFQFVVPPPLRIIPPLPSNMRGTIVYFVTATMGATGLFLLMLLISAVLHGGFFGYLQTVPPPPRDAGMGQLNERFTRLLVQEDPEELEVEPTDPTDPDENTEIPEETETIAEESAAGDEPEEDPGDPGPAGEETRTRDEIREQAAEAVVTQSALAAFQDSTGGINLGLASSDSLSERRAEEAMANQMARGAQQDGAVSSRGLGTSSGAEGRVSRQEVGGGGGGSAVAGAAQAQEAEEVEAVEVRANVRSQGSRTSGSGTLDDEELRGQIRRFQRRVQRCYERGLASNPSLAGRVELEFRVETSGQTSGARLPTNELGDAVGNCIIAEARRLRFPPPEGGSVVVRQRFVLQSGS